MGIVEDDLEKAHRARRGRRAIVPLLIFLWLVSIAIWIFKLSVLVDAGRQHGIASLSQLLSTALTFDESRKEFTRWEAFVMYQGHLIRFTLYSLMSVTIFLVSLLPVLNLIDRLASEVGRMRRSNSGDP